MADEPYVPGSHSPAEDIDIAFTSCINIATGLIELSRVIAWRDELVAMHGEQELDHAVASAVAALVSLLPEALGATSMIGLILDDISRGPVRIQATTGRHYHDLTLKLLDTIAPVSEIVEKCVEAVELQLDASPDYSPISDEAAEEIVAKKRKSFLPLSRAEGDELLAGLELEHSRAKLWLRNREGGNPARSQAAVDDALLVTQKEEREVESQFACILYRWRKVSISEIGLRVHFGRTLQRRRTQSSMGLL